MFTMTILAILCGCILHLQYLHYCCMHARSGTAGMDEYILAGDRILLDRTCEGKGEGQQIKSGELAYSDLFRSILFDS